MYLGEDVDSWTRLERHRREDQNHQGGLPRSYGTRFGSDSSVFSASETLHLFQRLWTFTQHSKYEKEITISSNFEKGRLFRMILFGQFSNYYIHRVHFREWGEVWNLVSLSLTGT